MQLLRVAWAYDGAQPLWTPCTLEQEGLWGLGQLTKEHCPLCSVHAKMQQQFWTACYEKCT